MTTGDSLPINVINIGMGDPMSVATSPNPALDHVQVQPRFEGIRDTIENIVIDVVKEQFNRRQGTDNITRNFIKFLTNACGLLEIRSMVVQKLEMWIMNPKISRPAQDLLMAVAMNCNTHTGQDTEVIGHFIKFRFKNKPNINLYLSVSSFVDNPTQKFDASPLRGANIDKQNSSVQFAFDCLILSHLTAIHVTKCGENYCFALTRFLYTTRGENV